MVNLIFVLILIFIERILQTCNDIKLAFRKHDLKSALEHTSKLKYWKTIDSQIKEKMY